MSRIKSSHLLGERVVILYLRKKTCAIAKFLMIRSTKLVDQTLNAVVTTHLFQSCNRAREVWKLSGFPFDNRGVHFREFIDLLWHLQFIQRVGNDLLELVIKVAWSMWFNRNAVRQGKARQQAVTILQKARLLLDEFQIANFQPLKPVMHDSGQWTNPSLPWYKVNVDGAVFESQQASGVGVLIGDHGGLVAAAFSKKVYCPLGP